MLAEVSPFVNSLQHITGFLVVLVVLTVLWGVTAILGTLFQRVRVAPLVDPPGRVVPRPGVVEGVERPLVVHRPVPPEGRGVGVEPAVEQDRRLLGSALLGRRLRAGLSVTYSPGTFLSPG